MMKVYVLGSGSSGNSVLINIEKTNILIDIGFSYKAMKNKLESIGYYPKDIDYILITHDHSDHIYGLKEFIKKNNPIVYTTPQIAELLFSENLYDKVNYYEDENLINGILVKVLPTSHDATTSCGFLIEYENESLVYITDTGYVHRRELSLIKDKTYYILESNHDTEMLIKGRYPLFLQKRILSDKGHLSNEICGGYLSQLIGPNTKKVMLAHLSHENNTPDIALETVNRIIREHDIEFNNIECASQEEVKQVNV